jgi:hypothetical protein
MRYVDITVKSVADVLKALKKQSSPNQLIWFRGQSVSTWNLVPSLARNANHLRAESALLKRFMQNAVPHLERLPVHEWEWMFMMQHHRAPTRLLDWSEGPLAALYFAVSEDNYLKKDAAVWCLDPVALNSDEARIGFRSPNEIPAFGVDKVLNSYLPSQVEEAPNVMNAVAIVGQRNNSRMVAQLGVFTVNHRDHKPLEEVGKAKHVWRWIIPAASKNDLRQELKWLGYTALSLFPELDRVADVAKELLQ